jgi:hypothetical protein
MRIYRTIKYLALDLGAAALCSCFGGSIAQQVARSLLLKGTDKATAIALDVDGPSRQLGTQSTAHQALAQDRYSAAFLHSGFAPMVIKVEPLPTLAEDDAIRNIQATKLVHVEIWSLLVGAEKQDVLEKAARLGVIDNPMQSEWRQWRVAIGARDPQKQTITFLIPPDIGEIYSGSIAWVELATVGELNVARYALP